ncbi:maleylpyruvate isomerase family mycothiol-dependent enzyme [Pseudoclavibacter chungangensis]|uniref:Maleylpyruvate isomerase family mycothiol-dependent enzyme n=1 Tax=Pseudoclavibacter chungangensis TaxID=587635 RepID=A0A7J5BSM9_9MICO|nr:maleylpyruvate isomerase family mycothiol-dependent enzyme [Pseudoclavibacter chungangensis]
MVSDSIAPDRPFFTPSPRVAGDWSAHIATSLDRTADVLVGFDEAQWSAPSLCEGWTVRDVVGHLVWRVGAPSGEMLSTASKAYFGHHVSPDRAIDDLARTEAEAPTAALVADLRRIADTKMQGIGRTGITELTEVVVHAFDITEALGVPLRLSPRSTSAVAVARTRIPFSAARRAVASSTLCASDARWCIGRGPRREATAGRLIAALFGRLPLPPVTSD